MDYAPRLASAPGRAPRRPLPPTRLRRAPERMMPGCARTILLTLAAAFGGPACAGPLDSPWHFQTPEPTTFLLLVIVLVLTAILGIGLYRALLLSHVKRIEHPHVLGWTLAFVVAGIDLWVFFALLYHKGFIGIGIPAVLATVFFFLAFMMILLGRVKQWVVFVLLALAALVIFQLLLS